MYLTDFRYFFVASPLAVCITFKRDALVCNHERAPNQSTHQGGAMAGFNLTSGRRMRVYHALALLNRSYHLSGKALLF
jgi:hypothetical protein